MGTIPQSYFRSPQGKEAFRNWAGLPSLEAVERALDERMQMGDLTSLMSDVVPDPVRYIGIVASDIANQVSAIEGGQNA